MTDIEQEPGAFADMPEHQASLVSSIGGLWPPEEASFGRVKAFYTPDAITSEDRFADLSGAFHESLSQMGNETVSRVQFRAIVAGNVLRKHAGEGGISGFVEAVIPLDPGEFGEEPVLVYAASNRSDRFPDAGDLARIAENYRQAIAVARRPVDAIFSRTNVNGYRIDILPKGQFLSEASVSQVAQLYERFGWTGDEVLALLTSPANIVAVARHGPSIVSAGIAEMAAVPIGGTMLRLAEITEAATLKTHERNGIYTAVSTRLLLELARLSRRRAVYGGELDLVFGECNGLAAGVLSVAKIQGRTFAAELGERYGFPESGILYQQVPIQGPARNTPYNDLLPAFLTRSSLYRYYEEEHP